MVSYKTLLLVMDISILLIVIDALLIMLGIKENRLDFNSVTGLSLVAAAMSLYIFFHNNIGRKETTEEQLVNDFKCNNRNSQ